jgi:large subunit ribosomal protein L17
MRHRKTIDKLNRTAAHRKATLANLSAALFERKHIQTTEAKAKATRRFSERLITLAKKETLHARRIALSRLRQKKIVNILFDEIAPKYTERQGGYTRVIKLGQRPGDGAHMAILELVDFDMASKKKKDKQEKSEAKKKAAKGETVPAEKSKSVDTKKSKTDKKKKAVLKKKETKKDAANSEKGKETKKSKAEKDKKLILLHSLNT